MHKQLTINSIILIFFVSMLTNTLGWSFNDKVITHELEHHHHAALFTADPQKHLELHHALADNGELDAATHLCLHAAGQFQPFFLNAPFKFIALISKAKALAVFVSTIIPESLPDPFFRPPRKFSVTL